MTLDHWDMDDDIDDDLYTLVGYFIVQFSGVELAMTALLASVSQVHDLQTFHTLILGADARAKIRKLRELSAPKKLIPAGGALDARLIHLYDKTIELRNRLAHGWLVQAKGRPKTLLIASLSKLPFKEFQLQRRPGDEPDRVTFEALQLNSIWLSDLIDDLNQLYRPALKRQTLEIKNPRSMDPRELQRRLAKIEKHASEHSQKQTPIAKR